MTKPELPPNVPGVGDSVEAHAAWISKAVRHEVVAAWRPGRTPGSMLVVRLADGREIVFETIGHAMRPEGLIGAFTAYDGVVVPAYSGPQAREVAAALVRMAQLDREQDERDEFADVGAHYLIGCLGEGLVDVKLDGDDEPERLSTYRTLLRYAVDLSRLRGDPGERWPDVLHAIDRRLFYLPRGLFSKFARRTLWGVSIAAFNSQMRRIGWEDVALRPRKPNSPEAERPHLRVWAVAEGWDGINLGEELALNGGGPVDPHGPASYTHARAGARGTSYNPSGTTGPNAPLHKRRGSWPC